VTGHNGFDLDQLHPTKCLTEAKRMSLSGPGPHIGWHINEGRTLNGLLSSYQIILAQANVLKAFESSLQW